MQRHSLYLYIMINVLIFAIAAASANPTNPATSGINVGMSIPPSFGGIKIASNSWDSTHQPTQKKSSQKKSTKSKTKSSAVSFKKDIFPVIKLNCLPCHTEDQMNPSELYLETYDDLMKGGKHGSPIIAGKADSSLIIKKLIAPPPFGDPMPLKRKTPLAADTVNILKKWIEQGAKNN